MIAKRGLSRLHRAALALAGCLSAILVLAGTARAEERPVRLDIWTIPLGTKVADIPDKFVEYACGTNGGPPAAPLKHFREFMRCRPDAAGLREVYFRYDDELEYWARALEQEREIRIYRGTQMYDYPVVVSLLIDTDGVVRGERIITDPRHTEIRDRIDFWTLGNFLRHRFNGEGWTCIDRPMEDGETPVGPDFVKQRCTKKADGVSYMVDQQVFRRKGQFNIDPNSGRIDTQAFTSDTRFEMFSDPWGAKEGL